MKKRTSASGLLTELGTTLLKYASSVELKSEIRLARGILVSATRNINSSRMLAIENLSSKISDHAMQILQAQQAQMLGYTIAEGHVLPNGMKTYVVQRARRSSLAEQLPNEAERIHEDYGIPSTHATEQVRHMTINACTCQFQSCWGLPCRHMLRLYFQLQMVEIPEGVVKPRWFTTHDAEYVAQAKRDLLRTLPMEAGSYANKERKMTRSERYNYLLSESKAICEVAAISEAAMEVMVKGLDKAKLEISKLELPNDFDEDDMHSLDPSLFPFDVRNPGLPVPYGRAQTKRKENSGKAQTSKNKKKKA